MASDRLAKGSKHAHRCIYCRGPGPLTREHIVPQSMGGTVWCYLVCDSCRFSHLDQALAERSHISVDRVGRTPKTAHNTELGGSAFHYDGTLDLHLESFLNNGLHPHPLPQLHFRPRDDGSFAVIKWARDEADFAKLVDFIEMRAQQGAVRDIPLVIGPEERCTTTRIYLDRSDRGFIRGATEAEARAVLEKVEARWYWGLRKSITESSAEPRSDAPNVRIRPGNDLDLAMRGVAKIAFNFAAMELGAELLLRPEFDAIREYICDDKPYSYDEEAFAYDCRFVALWQTRPESPWSHHTVAVRSSSRGIQAIVMLYGMVHTVDLAPLAIDVFACRRFGIAGEGATSHTTHDFAEVIHAAGIDARNLDNEESWSGSP